MPRFGADAGHGALFTRLLFGAVSVAKHNPKREAQDSIVVTFVITNSKNAIEYHHTLDMVKIKSIIKQQHSWKKKEYSLQEDRERQESM
jgi:hypothetical protein